jgi:hypothetical protein
VQVKRLRAPAPVAGGAGVTGSHRRRRARGPLGVGSVEKRRSGQQQRLHGQSADRQAIRRCRGQSRHRRDRPPNRYDGDIGRGARPAAGSGRTGREGGPGTAGDLLHVDG